MCRIVLMDSFRLLTSQACIRMNDLPGCWHLFTDKGIFHEDSLVNDLAGHVTFGPANTLTQNSIHCMYRILRTFLMRIIRIFPQKFNTSNTQYSVENTPCKPPPSGGVDYKKLLSGLKILNRLIPFLKALCPLYHSDNFRLSVLYIVYRVVLV